MKLRKRMTALAATLAFAAFAAMPAFAAEADYGAAAAKDAQNYIHGRNADMGHTR